MSKIYDLSQLEELAGGSMDFVMSMVDTFLEHTPGQVVEMETEYINGNLAKVGGIAHKIKPNIDLFGIQEIMPTVRSIEAKGKAEEDSATLKEEIQYLKATLETVFEQLRELRA
jgi:HPt (histidine-containing phosphotransfer) domain-containing protein